MLPKLFSQIDEYADVNIRKFEGARDVSNMGAFCCGAIVDLEVSISRILGITTPVLRICRDGEGQRDIPMIFKGSDGVSDIYCLAIDTQVLCGEAGCKRKESSV